VNKHHDDNFSLEALESRVLLSADNPLAEAPVVSAEPLTQVDVPLMEAQESAGQALTVTQDSLVLLTGEESVVIGSDTMEDHITLGDGSSDSLELGDQNVLIQADELVIASPISGGNLTVVGDGSTTDLYANITDAGNVTINDAVVVHGARTITAAGDIIIGLPSGSINGDGTGEADSLTLSAGGDIQIAGPIGNLNALTSLTITNATSVTFNGQVIVSGAVNISGASLSELIFASNLRATSISLGASDLISVAGNLTSTAGTTTLTTTAAAGAVTVAGQTTSAGNLTFDLNGNLTLGGAVKVTGDLLVTTPQDVSIAESVTVSGSLTQNDGTGSTRFQQAVQAAGVEVTNALLVAFEGDLTSTADVTIKSDEIDFATDSDAVKAPGHIITLLPYAADTDIYVGLPASGEAAILDITDSDINALDKGFAKIVIGRATDGSGTVTMGSSQILDNLEVYAGSLIVTEPVDVAGTVLFDMQQDITFKSNLVASGDVTLLAEDGVIDQTAGRITAPNLNATADDGITLITAVDTIQATVTGSGDITINELDGLTINGTGLVTPSDDVIVTLAAGDLVLDKALTLGGAGRAILTALSGNIVLNESISAASGDVSLSASNDVSLDAVSTGGNVTVTADSDADGAGAILDALAGEAANLTAATATLSAGDGIGTDDDIDTNLTTLIAENTGTTGDIRVTEVAAGGNLAVSRVSQSAATGSGDIALATAGGNLVLPDSGTGIGVQGTGVVDLDAIGGIDLSAGISTTTGAVTIDATGTTSLAAGVTLTTDGGNVTFGASKTGTLTCSGTIETNGGDVVFTNALTLAGDSAVDSGGGDITAISAVDGDQKLTLTAGAGTIGFASTVDLKGLAIVSAASVNFDSTVEIASDHLAISAGDITFNDDVTTTNGGTVEITNSGLLTLANAADLTLDGSFTQNGTGAVTSGASITTTADAISFATEVSLTEDVVLTSSSSPLAGDITFTSNVKGDFLLTLDAGAGNIELDTVGVTTPLSGLTVTSAATLTATGTLKVDDEGLIITAGVVSLNGVTTSNGGAVKITNSGLLTLTGTMSLDSSFIQDGTGTVSLASDITTTADAISFASEVSLDNDVSLSTGSLAGDITFSSNVIGGHKLTLTAGTGDIAFNSTVGSGQRLRGLGIASADNANFVGTVAVDDEGLVISAVNVTFNQAVSTANDGLIDITNTGLLSFAAAADVTSDGTFTQQGGGTVETAADITTTGDTISFAAEITLTGDVSLTSSSSPLAGDSGDITFASTIDGPRDLTLDAGTGNVSFADKLGATAALTNLTIAAQDVSFSDTVATTADVTITNSGVLSIVEAADMTLGGNFVQSGGSVETAGEITTSTGDVSFGADVALTGDVAVDTAGGDLTFAGKVNGARQLTVKADAGTINFVGTVGDGTSLSGLQVTSANVLNFDAEVNVAGNIDITAGFVTFDEAVTTTGDGWVEITNSDTLTLANAADLTLDGSFTQNGTGAVTSGASISTTGDDITFATEVSLTENVTLTSSSSPLAGDSGDSGDIIFTSNVQGNVLLTLAAGTGNIDFDGTVGAGTPLSGLQIASAANLTFDKTVAVDDEGLDIAAENVTFHGAVATTTGGSVSIANTALLTIAEDADFTLAGTFAQTTESGTVDLAGEITTKTFGNADVSFAGAVALSGPVTIDTSAGKGTVSFANSLDGAEDLILKAGAGNVFFADELGALTALTSLTISAKNVDFAATLTTTADVTITNSGVLTLAEAADLTLGGSFAQNGGGSVSTAGDISAANISFADVVTLDADVSLTSSSSPLAGAIDFDSDVTGDHKLTLDAGTGTIDFNSTVGETSPLSGLLVTAADDLTFDRSVKVGAEGVELAATRVRFAATLSVAGDIEVAAEDVSFDQAVTTTNEGAVSIANTGVLAIAEAADFALDGAFAQTGGGTVRTAADITTSDADISFADAVTLTAAVTLTSSSSPLAGDAGDIRFADTVDGPFDLVLNAGVGNVSFADELGAGTALTNLTIAAADVDFAATVTVTADVTITNSGVLTLAEAADMTLGGSFAQSGGGSVSTAGDITSAANISFADVVTLDADVSLSSSSSSLAGAITFDSDVTGGHRLTLAAASGAINFNSTVGETSPLSGLNITSAAAVVFAGTVEVAGEDLTISAEDVTFHADVTTTDAGSVTIENTGLLTFDAVQLTLDGAFSQSGGGTVETAANITTTGDDISFCDIVTLTGDVTLNSSSSSLAGDAGDIIFCSDVTGDHLLTLDAAEGEIVFTDGASAALRGLRIADAANLTFNDTVRVGAQNLAITAGNVSFHEAVATTNGGTVEITNSGLLTLANAADLALDGSFTQNGTGPVTSGASITTTGDDITFATALSLTENVLLTSSSSSLAGDAGDITFAGTVEGTVLLTLNAGTGDIRFQDRVSVDGLEVDAAANLTFADTVTAGPQGVDIYAGNVTIQDDVTTTAGGELTITNSGQLSIGNDVTVTSSGNVSFDGTGPVSSGADIATDGTDISFASELILTDDVTLSSSSSPLAGDITFAANVKGDYLLTLAAGAGDIAFNRTLGDDVLLSGLLVESAASLTFHDTVAVRNEGIDITAGAVTFKQPVTVTGTGTVEITNSDTLTIEVSAVMTLDGSFTQNGTGMVRLAGDIATTNDDISFASAVTLAADVALSSSSSLLAGDAGDITFAATIDGPFDLSLTAGTVAFDAALGADSALNSLTVTADTATLNASVVTVGDIVVAAALELTSDLALTSTTGDIAFDETLTGEQQLTLAADSGDIDFADTVDLTGLTIASASSATFAAPVNLAAGGLDITAVDVTITDTITTTNGGTVEITNSGTLAFADSAALTLDGSFTQNGAGPVELTTDLAIATADADITFDSSISAESLRPGILAGSSVASSTIGDALLTLTSGAGDITLDSAVTLGGLLIDSTASIDINGTVTSQGRGIDFTGGDVDLALQLTALDSDTIFLEALTGDLTIVTGAVSDGGNIRLVAANNVKLTGINAGTGAVSIDAGVSILDVDVAGLDIMAGELRMTAGAGIGQLAGSVNPLQISVDTLAASAGAEGISLLESDELTIGTVDTVPVNRIGGGIAEDGRFLAGLATRTDGDIVVRTAAGTLTVAREVTADGTGNILLQAQGADSDVYLNASVVSGTGNISVLAADSVYQAATVEEGASFILTSSMLHYTDADNDDATLVYQITSAPSYGSILLDGVPTTTFTQDELDHQRVTYQHDGGENDCDAFEFTVNDANGGVIAGSFDIYVDPINDAPTITVPASSETDRLDTNEGVAIAFTGDNAIRITDVDSGEFPISVTLTITDARAALSLDTGDLTVTGDASSMTLTGPVADLNTALATLVYTVTADTFFDDTLTVTVDDAGNTSKQGAKADAAQIFIKVNDVPELAVNSGLTLDEGATATIDDTLLSVIDGDNDPIFILATNVTNGTLMLGDEVLETGDRFTQTDIDKGLLSYSHNAGETAADGFTFSVLDGDGGVIAETIGFAISVNPVNDLPVLSVPGAQYTTGGAAITLEPIAFSDADAGTSHAVTLTLLEGLTGNALSAKGTLSVLGDHPGVSIVGDGTSIALTGTMADLNALLIGSLQWLNSATAEQSLYNRLVVSVDDGEDVVERTVTLKANVAPQVVNVGKEIDEGETGLIDSDTLLYSDIDNEAADLVYTLESLPEQITLFYTNNRGKVALAVGDRFTQADVDAGRISYEHDGSEPLARVDFNYSVSDGHGAELSGLKFSFFINAVNDAPVVTLPTGMETNVGVALALQNIAISDADDADLTVTLSVTDGSTLTISGTAPVVANNGTGSVQLSGTQTEINQWLAGLADGTTELLYTPALASGNGTDTLTVNVSDGKTATSVDTAIRVNAVPNAISISQDVDRGSTGVLTGLSFADADGDTLTYTITAIGEHIEIFKSGTELAVDSTFTQAELDDGEITYVQDGTKQTSTTFSFTLTDGHGGDIGETVFTFAVDPIVIDVPAAQDVNVGEVLQVPTITVFDDDAGVSSVILSLFAGDEGVELTTDAVLSVDALGLAGNNTAQLTLTGTLAEINALLAQVTLVQTTADHATMRLTVSATDGTNTQDETVSVRVNLVPVLVNNTGLTLDETGTATITEDHLLVTDGDNINIELIYTLTAAPAYGTLLVDGKTLSVGDTFMGEDIESGYLQYVHGGTEEAADLFSFTVSDGHTGVVAETAVNLTINDVNDPLVLTAVEYIERNVAQSGQQLDGLSIALDDPDLEPNTLTTVTLSLDAGSSLTVSDAGGLIVSGDGTNVLTLTGTYAEAEAWLETIAAGGLLSYAPRVAVATFEGEDIDTFRVEITAGTENATASSEIRLVNHVPVQTAASLTIGARLATTILTSSDLAFADADGDSLTYTLTAVALNGTLSRDGVALGVGDSFTQADVDAGLIAYTHTVEDTTSDTFSFTLSDSRRGDIGATGFAISVIKVTVPETIIQPEGSENFDLPGIEINDDDSTRKFTLTLALSGDVTEVNLRVDETDGVRIKGSGTTTITLSGAAEAVNQALLTLRYESERTDDYANTLTVTADYDGGSLVRTAQIKLNDTPVTAKLSGDVAEGATSAITVSVVDGDNADSELVYTLQSLPQYGLLALNGQPLNLTDNSCFTQADVDAGLVTYTHDGSETPLSDSFTFTVVDGDGGEIGLTTYDLTITPVNDAPVLSVPDGTLYTNEGVALVIGGVSVADVDSTEFISVIVATTSANANVATLSATAAGSAVVGNVDIALLISGTLADVNATLASLTYIPTVPDAFYTDGLAIRVSDGDKGVTGAISLRINDVPSLATIVNSVRVATTGGTIDMEAAAGNIVQADGALISGNDGKVRLLANDSIILSGVDAGAGAVAITAETGSILDAATIYDVVFADASINSGDKFADVVAASLRLDAAVGIGQLGDLGDPLNQPNALEISVDTLTAVAGTDGINLDETDGLTVDQVSVTVNRVQANAEVADETNVTDAAQSDLTTAGSLVLTAGDSLVLNDGHDADDTAVSATGNVLLTSGQDLTVNADVVSAEGDLSLIAANDLNQAAAGDLQTSGGTIDVEATDGDITMDNGATAISNDGDIRYLADGDVSLGGLNAGTANVSVIATKGTIYDSGDTNLEIEAAGARLSAGTGIGEFTTGNTALDIAVDTVSALAGKGGVNLSEADDVAVSAVEVEIDRVRADATTQTVTDEARDDLATNDGGSIVLSSRNGTITIADGDADGIGVSADGLGNVLIQALAAGQNVVIDVDVLSELGHISILAADAVEQNADLATSAGDIEVAAGTGAITMADDTSATADAGSIRYRAALNAVLELLQTNTGNVAVIAGGSIVDGDAETDIVASDLILSAGGDIGGLAAGTDPLEIDVDRLTASADTGDSNIFEVDMVEVTQLTVSVEVVQANASTDTESNTQSDLQTMANGAIILRVLSGNLTISEGDADDTGVDAAGSGVILLQAAGDVTLDADVASQTGAISILAGGDVNQNADLTTDATVDVEAAGSIEMAASASTMTASDNIRYTADGDIEVGTLDARTAGSQSTWGAIALSAAGSITDASSADSATDLYASAARLSAGAGIGELGAAVNPLETEVAILAASSGTTGISLVDATELEIGTVAPVSVDRVQADATTQAETDTADLSGLVSVGAVVQRTVDGDVTIANPVAAAGNILLETQGADHDLILNAAVDSDTGSVSILATGDVDQNADVAAPQGTVDVGAGGDIVMADGTAALTDGGNIRYSAGGAIELGLLDTRTAADRAGSTLDEQAQWGEVALKAGGSITDAASEEPDGLETVVDLYASAARLEAGNGLGEFDGDTYENADIFDELETEAITLATDSGTGVTNIADATNVLVREIGTVPANRVGIDGSTTAVAADAVLSGQSGDGLLFQQSESGDLIITDLDVTHVRIGEWNALPLSFYANSGDYSPKFSGDEAVDGDSTTAWSTPRRNDDTQEEFYTIDLGEITTVSRFRLLARDGFIDVFPEDFTISVSTDGVNWTEVVSEAGYEATEGEWYSVSIEDTQARYVKLTSKARMRADGGYYLEIAEFQVCEGLPVEYAQLTWTAPGDLAEGIAAGSYEVRWSYEPIIESEQWLAANVIDGAPVAVEPGGAQTMLVPIADLPADAKLYFAVRAIDTDGTVGAFSNTEHSYLRNPQRPATITDLELTVDSASSSILLEWTAVGNDGYVGNAASYDIRWSTSELTTEEAWNSATQVDGEPAPRAAGETETWSVDMAGMPTNVPVYVAIKAVDAVTDGLASTLSNSVGVTIDRETEDVTLTLSAGWNMVNLPLGTSGTVQSVFGDLITGSVWQWTGTVYQTVETLLPNVAYWVYSLEGGTLQLTGSVPETGVVDLKSGWNMIGVSSEVKASALNVDSTKLVWRWNAAANSYEQVTADETLKLGEAYWVYSSADQVIALKSAVPARSLGTDSESSLFTTVVTRSASEAARDAWDESPAASDRIAESAPADSIVPLAETSSAESFDQLVESFLRR
jgi:hypothetical protein